MLRNQYLLFLACWIVTAAAFAQETPFSGPQVGERLLPFQVRQALGAQSGEMFDPVGLSEGGPMLIVFVHEATRPSIALTRTIVNYANRFQAEGLRSSVIFLTDDPTETQAFLQRAQHALPPDTVIGMSTDGLEGPGTYGLNRKMTLTVLVGKQDRVTANFALIQPSLAADAPRIGAAIQAVLGKDHQPDLAEMGVDSERGGQAMDDGAFRRMLGPVIQRTANEQQVAEAAKAVEAHAAENPAFRKRLGEVTHRIISAGVLENYGTPAAQEYLRTWARQYGPADSPAPAEKP